MLSGLVGAAVIAIGGAAWKQWPIAVANARTLKTGSIVEFVPPQIYLFIFAIFQIVAIILVLLLPLVGAGSTIGLIANDKKGKVEVLLIALNLVTFPAAFWLAYEVIPYFWGNLVFLFSKNG